jgi:ABC-type antimicrobial peptide transport system permease subunit
MDWAVFAVRSPLPAQQVLSIIRREVASFDSSLPIGNEGTLESVIYGSLSRERFMMFMLGVFAGVALLLAAVGVYGIIAYIVEQRKHEIGIRMALGALPRDVVALVGGRVLAITALGITIGVLGSIVGSKAMTKLIFDIAAIDSITYVASALTLILAAGIAAFIPTLRATRVDPVRAIRAQ